MNRFMNPSRCGATAAVHLIVAVVAVTLSACGSSAQQEAAPPPALSVTLVQPTQEQWPQVVRANGAVAAWHEAVISAETGSLRVAEVRVDVGARVTRGQLLARLADDTVKADLRKQEAVVAEAQAGLEQAEANLRRSQAVAGSGALSTQQLDQYRVAAQTARATLASAQADLESRQIRLRQARITAVDDGVISSRSAQLGAVVAAGTELFRLVRQDRVEWRAEVDAQQLVQIKAGQVARLTLVGGLAVEGTVRLASPTLSEETGRAIVYVSLPANSGARPGMHGSGTIELAATLALSLPESALVLRDGRSDVYVLDSDGNTVARRTVETGRRRDGRVELLSGLDADARVVASGGAFLSHGAIVQVVQDSGQAATP